MLDNQRYKNNSPVFSLYEKWRIHKTIMMEREWSEDTPK